MYKWSLVFLVFFISCGKGKRSIPADETGIDVKHTSQVESSYVPDDIPTVPVISDVPKEGSYKTHGVCDFVKTHIQPQLKNRTVSAREDNTIKVSLLDTDKDLIPIFINESQDAWIGINRFFQLRYDYIHEQSLIVHKATLRRNSKFYVSFCTGDNINPNDSRCRVISRYHIPNAPKEPKESVNNAQLFARKYFKEIKTDNSKFVVFSVQINNKTLPISKCFE